MGNLFKGRMQVPYYYSCFGYSRGGGKTWHGGQDVVGLDSDAILMPDYDGKSISGTVVTARKVEKSTGNRTWEWGWYVCVKLDADQTPDAVNYLYFCHNDHNVAAVGRHVKSGDVLAVMGNTGNAAEATPPIRHCHLEVRATATGKGLAPAHYSGCANRVGIDGENPVKPLSGQAAKLKISASKPISAGDVVLLKEVCDPLGISTREENGALITAPASAGDQITIIREANRLNLRGGVHPGGQRKKRRRAGNAAGPGRLGLRGHRRKGRLGVPGPGRRDLRKGGVAGWSGPFFRWWQLWRRCFSAWGCPSSS